MTSSLTIPASLLHSLEPRGSGLRFVPTGPEPSRPPRGTNEVPGVQTGAERVVPPQFGRLASLLRDARVSDVFVTSSGEVWMDSGGGTRLVRTVHLDAAESRALAVSLVALGGRHIDEATPCCDVRLADGLRVHAVLPPVSRAGTVLSIRAPSTRILRLSDLEERGVFEQVPLADVLRRVERRANLLVTGAGGSGKTTLLGALLSAADPSDRIVTLEDVAELRIDRPHVVSLETRQPNLEGAGGIDLARLVREALRMRPDRLVVGECRGEELRELLSALNTGHDGGAGTLHANSLETVPARLEALGALAGLSPTALASQAVSAFDVVLHLERREGRRVLTGLASFEVGRDGRLAVTAIPAGS